MKQVQLAIIGGGPAGLSAAIAARKAGVEDILLIERDRELGGILNQCIQHFFLPVRYCTSLFISEFFN